jgi:hypothetical protein
MKIVRVKLLFLIVEMVFAISSLTLIFTSTTHRKYPFPPPSPPYTVLELSSTVSGVALLIFSIAFLSKYPGYSKWGLAIFLGVVCLGLLFPAI